MPEVRPMSAAAAWCFRTYLSMWPVAPSAGRSSDMATSQKDDVLQRLRDRIIALTTSDNWTRSRRHARGSRAPENLPELSDMTRTLVSIPVAMPISTHCRRWIALKSSATHPDRHARAIPPSRARTCRCLPRLLALGSQGDFSWQTPTLMSCNGCATASPR